MWSLPTGCFEVAPLPKTDDHPWKSDENKKKEFGIAIAKGIAPFAAASAILDETSSALWVSQNWLTDPVVIAARDSYLNTRKSQEKILDKDALCVKLLEFVDEKDTNGRFLINEGKDRLQALRLYAEIKGFIGKVDINASTNYTNNLMKIVLVKPENQEKPTLIDNDLEQAEIVPLPGIKLVK